MCQVFGPGVMRILVGGEIWCGRGKEMYRRARVWLGVIENRSCHFWYHFVIFVK
jgi:hypothetical protein